MSLPHQPPLYGVSSLWPMSSVMSGPTIVPWRVIVASIAVERQLSRRMILTSGSAATVFSAFFQSRSDLMKKVVRPESPYGAWTTRSSPSPPPRARSSSSR